MDIEAFRVTRQVSTLRHQVADGLRNAICGLVFTPGQRLVERELTEMFGVSRTLIREALSQLTAEGLVQLIPHKGPIVAIVGAEEARGLYKVRGELEALAAREFTQNANADERAALVASLKVLESKVAGGLIPEFLKAKADFYAALLQGAHNQVLQEMLRLIHGRVTTLRAATLSQPGRLSKSAKEISAIVTAIRKNDAEAAANAARTHVQNAAIIASKLDTAP
jgi:GntR family transcriptional regulator, trigonelline degradation regulator